MGNRSGVACRASVRPCPAPPARAHCFSENRSRRLGALRSAVKTDKNGAFRYSENGRAVFVACERSEVLTARERSALQSRAVFRRNAPGKNGKRRPNGLSRRYA